MWVNLLGIGFKMFTQLCTVQGKILAGENIGKFANHEPIAKIFLANIASEKLFGICTDFSLFIMPI